MAEPTVLQDKPTQAQYDVFISHSHDDRAWVDHELVPRLEKAGLKVGIDRRWKAGAPIPEKIEEAIQNSTHTVVVLTESWLSSDWCALEKRLLISSDPAASRRRLVPVLLQDCREHLPKLFRSISYRDFTDESTSDEQWSLLLRDVVPEKKESLEPGLTALADLMQRNREVSAAVIKSQAALMGVSEKVEILTAYKEVHDCFQKLEDAVNLLAADARHLSDDAQLWRSVERDEAQTFRPRQEELVEAAKQAPFASDESIWVEDMLADAQRLRESIEDEDAGLCDEVVDDLSEVFSREPARINTKLVDKAKELQLGGLLNALSKIDNELALQDLHGEAADQRAAFCKSFAVLEQYHARLRKLVQCHSILQRICDELTSKDPFRFEDVRQFQNTWRYQKRKLDQLRGVGEIDCLAEIWPKADAVEQQLSVSRNVKKIRHSYSSYQGTTNRVFNKVNTQLKYFCENQLKELGESLARLMEKMQHE